MSVLIIPIFQLDRLRLDDGANAPKEGRDLRFLPRLPGCPSPSLSSLIASSLPCRNQPQSVSLVTAAASCMTWAATWKPSHQTWAPAVYSLRPLAGVPMV